MMPFVYPADKVVGETDQDVATAARVAVILLVASGWWHLDLSWRHVGLYRTKEGQLKAVLFDLGHVRKLQEGEGLAATKAMLKALNLEEVEEVEDGTAEEAEVED